MAYSQYGKIEAADFNAFVGNAIVGITTADTLNTVWGIGSGNNGYGQTGIPQVSVNTTIVNGDWANLLNTTTTIARHQNTAITSVTVPQQGDKIEVIAPIATNLTSIYTNRLNATAQGSSVPITTTVGTAWSSAITFTHVVSFTSADTARYFFNTGGQIALTFSHPTGSGVNALMSALGTACGTLVLSAPNSGTATIAGTSYSGISKIDGSGSVTTIVPNAGFYGLTTTNQEVFKQLGTGTPSAYAGSFISVNARINALPGSGSVITITTLWDEVPNGGATLGLTSGTATTCTVRYPSTSYLANTWSSVGVVGSVTGS